MVIPGCNTQGGFNPAAVALPQNAISPDRYYITFTFLGAGVVGEYKTLVSSAILPAI